MGAKAIIQRYIDRNRSRLPSDSSRLREHIASVAEGSGLRLTEEELESLTPTLSQGEGENTPQPTEGGAEEAVIETVENKAKKRRNKASDKKTGDNASATV